MADWNKPTLTSTYTNFLSELTNRDADLARNFTTATTAGTNLVDETIRWNAGTGTKKWQIYNSSTSTWSDLATTYNINVEKLGTQVLKTAPVSGDSGYVPSANGTKMFNLNAHKLDGKVWNTSGGAGNIPVCGATGTAGTVQAGLNSDFLDSRTVGTASGNIPYNGAGLCSGLDADKLDGLHSSSFIRSDADDTVSGHTEWQDNKEIRLGTDNDAQFYHDGTDTYITSSTGNLKLKSSVAGKGLTFSAKHATDTTIDTCISATSATTELYAEGSKKLWTTETGVEVTGDVKCSGQFDETSARKYKENIKPITGALSKLLKLEGVTYNKKDSGKQELGLVADDVEKVLPELVGKDKGEVESLSYTRLTSVLVEAVKELTAKVESLETQLKGV